MRILKLFFSSIGSSGEYNFKGAFLGNVVKVVLDANFVNCMVVKNMRYKVAPNWKGH